MTLDMIDLVKEDLARIAQAAALLQENFEAWPTMEAADGEVRESLEEGRISRVLVNPEGAVLGWIGGISQYSGNVWELHPLVVDKSYRKQGFGMKLVLDLEEQVRLRGGVTIYLGTDDEYDQTSLSGKDLYSDIPGHIQQFQSPDHPANFYRKAGFTIVGVIPDANGIGKPDILMAKRVTGR